MGVGISTISLLSNEYSIKDNTLRDGINNDPNANLIISEDITHNFDYIMTFNQTPTSHIPIGGTVYYDDGDNGATYTFYDDSGNKINYTGTISQLANATQYDISGTKSKDRFYVYNENAADMSTILLWDDGSYENCNTSIEIGSGKSNTTICLQKYGNINNTIWYWLNQCNINEIGGYNDWFIPSKNEMTQGGSSNIGNIIPMMNYNYSGETSVRIWCSSEFPRYDAYIWTATSSSFSWYVDDKNGGMYTIFAIRAF